MDIPKICFHFIQFLILAQSRAVHCPQNRPTIAEIWTHNRTESGDVQQTFSQMTFLADWLRLAACATCFNKPSDGFIDAVYLSLWLRAGSKQTAHQDEWQGKEWQLDQLRGWMVGQMILPANTQKNTHIYIYLPSMCFTLFNEHLEHVLFSISSRLQLL